MECPQSSTGSAELAEDTGSNHSNDACVLGEQSLRQCTRGYMSKLSTRGNLKEREQSEDAVSAAQEKNHCTGEVSDNSAAAAATHEATNSVLSWWRSQRLITNSEWGIKDTSQVFQEQCLLERRTGMNDFAIDSRSPGLKTVDRPSDGQDEPWTKAQLHSLRCAQAGTELSKPDFWGAVASNVRDRDPRQCQRKWFEHFATPRGRRKKVLKTSRSATRTTLSDNPSTLSRDTVTAVHHPDAMNQPGDRNDDDLFQATPMRGRSQFGVKPTGAVVEIKSPSTPAGPGVSALDVSNEKGESSSEHKRGISRTYVKALAKRIRKGGQEKLGLPSQEPSKPPFASADRAIYAGAISRGHKLKACVTSLGAVNVTSNCSGEDDMSLSSESESDDE